MLDNLKKCFLNNYHYHCSPLVKFWNINNACHLVDGVANLKNLKSHPVLFIVQASHQKRLAVIQTKPVISNKRIFTSTSVFGSAFLQYI